MSLFIGPPVGSQNPDRFHGRGFLFVEMTQVVGVFPGSAVPDIPSSGLRPRFARPVCPGSRRITLRRFVGFDRWVAPNFVNLGLA